MTEKRKEAFRCTAVYLDGEVMKATFTQPLDWCDMEIDSAYDTDEIWSTLVVGAYYDDKGNRLP